MSLFHKSQNESAFLKAGLIGFAGTGKSRTAAEIAIGLHKHIKSKAPVCYLDTETGSDYLKGIFDKNKIQLNTSKSRAFVDLMVGIDEAEQSGSILIIDSITHYWNELCDALKKEKKVDRLVIHHWMTIKQQWRPFSEKYINSKCHIIMCGRAGWEFDKEIDDEGFSELVKTGTKMKGESELGFEPSLLIEMEKVRTKKGKIGGNYIRRAWIIKDRFDVIDGQFFDNPAFDSFFPHVKLLNLGGEHVGVTTEKDSKELFKNDNRIKKLMIEKDILVEEINNELLVMFDRSDAGKKARIELLNEVFTTSSKIAIESLNIDALQRGLYKIQDIKKANKKKKKNKL